MKPDPMIKCPCCHGSGKIPERSPVRLTPLQFRIWDVVRRSDGITAEALTKQVYAQHWDGGPETASKSVCVTVHHANKRLAAVGQKIVSSGGPGSQYRLQYLDSK